MKSSAIPLVIGFLIVLSGCYSYQASTAPTPQAAVGLSHRVRVTLTDGSMMELRDASARGDSIAGADIAKGKVIVVAANKVQKVETGRLNVGRTAAVAIGATVTGAVIYEAMLHIMINAVNR